MTIAELQERLDAELLAEGAPDASIKDCYAGDFLSRVMSKAPADCAWFTVMANVNVAGVAVLAEVKAVVLCEGVRPDPALTERCRQEGIALLCTQKDVFCCCRAV